MKYFKRKKTNKACSNNLPIDCSNNLLLDSSNIIDRISFYLDTKRTVSDDFACSKHQDVGICMIDIVGFSQWCSKQNPIDIFKTMTMYNTFLNDKIALFNNIEKVELVGDSVLIVEGLYSKERIDTKNIFKLCYTILSDINQLKLIFNDQSISIRIGVHVGDVYSGFILNPRKFQLFGNSINVASRLESSGLPGVLHISAKASKYISNIDTFFEVGKTLTNKLKGVGILDSMLCFVRNDKIIIADDVLTTCNIIERHLQKSFDAQCLKLSEVKSCFDHLKQQTYTCVLLDRYFDDMDVLSALTEFRIWESKYRSTTQKIILMSTISSTIFETSMDSADSCTYSNEYKIFELYVDSIIDKRHNFIETILSEINSAI